VFLMLFFLFFHRFSSVFCVDDFVGVFDCMCLGVLFLGRADLWCCFLLLEYQVFYICLLYFWGECLCLLLKGRRMLIY
jgi:hypothetical protein